MSISDVSQIRELFKDCSIEEVSTNCKMLEAHEQKKVTELLIRNDA